MAHLWRHAIPTMFHKTERALQRPLQSLSVEIISQLALRSQLYSYRSKHFGTRAGNHHTYLDTLKQRPESLLAFAQCFFGALALGDLFNNTHAKLSRFAFGTQRQRNSRSHPDQVSILP